MKRQLRVLHIMILSLILTFRDWGIEIGKREWDSVLGVRH